ncbi:tRNA (adenosine(37)-N6)-threonylcarbamoyltransferase complex dimerization subunit type 1 TsaB [Stella sp.]|uniref:tRNA (adenosine(37)-N6)-threonylcarbamoyltransferase complex dimerization subunit type 1 TsaB n=1 Tax=Stella sp. TaxID=2912054 RepID=UPI0035B00FFB
MGLTLLALDSAGAACSAALWRDGRVVAARRLATERGHAQHLAPLVAAVLDAPGGRVPLDGVVATTGPGSFTGLRVGLALAQGVALAAGVPAWGVSSFRVHAEAAGAAPGRPLLVALDSRRAELFLQWFPPGGAEAPFMATPAAAAERLRRTLRGPVALAGDAAGLLAAALAAVGVQFEVLRADPADAADVAATAAAMLAAGEAMPPARPSYLRPPDVTVAAPA